jgi:hypothetical protein
MLRRGALCGVFLLALLGCRGEEPGEPLLAAFSGESRVGRLQASWGSAAAKQGTVRYRVEVRNQLADSLYVRLERFRVLDGTTVVGAADEAVGCIVPAHGAATVLKGAIDLAAAGDRFEVERFAVPLSERGRTFYREYRLRQRAEPTAIDAEIAAYAAAPECRNDED